MLAKNIKFKYYFKTKFILGPQEAFDVISLYYKKIFMEMIRWTNIIFEKKKKNENTNLVAVQLENYLIYFKEIEIGKMYIFAFISQAVSSVIKIDQTKV